IKSLKGGMFILTLLSGASIAISQVYSFKNPRTRTSCNNWKHTGNGNNNNLCKIFDKEIKLA
ncbi:L-lactate permease, partial [Borrelia duttonii CR2A]